MHSELQQKLDAIWICICSGLTMLKYVYGDISFLLFRLDIEKIICFVTSQFVMSWIELKRLGVCAFV